MWSGCGQAGEKGASPRFLQGPDRSEREESEGPQGLGLNHQKKEELGKATS